MEYFELYLDESGQFRETNQSGRPSIVSGYMMRRKCSEAWGRQVLSKVKSKAAAFENINIDEYHAMETDNHSLPEFNVLLMEELENNGAEMIVFKNHRGNQVVNSDITYLNVFADGVLELSRHLLTKYKDNIQLNILYASRIWVEEKERDGSIFTIKQNEYMDRIQERIILRMAQVSPRDRNRIQYRLQWGKAKTSYLLMIADAINFSFRGGVSKFSDEQKNRIKSLKQLSFSTLEHGAWQIIQSYIAGNRLADAVYSWYGEYYDELKLQHTKEFNELILSNLQQLGLADIKVQFDILSQQIKALVDTRNYETANKLMERISQKLFPILSENKLLPTEVDFDLHFFRLTTATHQGDMEGAEQQIKICRDKLSGLPATWETMDYYISYKLREVEHLKNKFDFIEAISNLNKLERILNDAVSVVQMIDELGSFGENLKSTTLGKVLGSRVTARCYYSLERPDELALARLDSDAALEQFSNEYDKKRQYTTRTMVEYMDGNFEEALEWLCRACDIEEYSPEELLEALKRDKNRSVFSIYYYTGLMAAALLKGHKIGEEMFDSWNKITPEEIIPDSREYPVNIILWKIGTCKAFKQSGAAAEYYHEAVSVTNNQINNLPNYVARLAMKAEYAGLLEQKNFKKNFQSFNRDYQKWKEHALTSTKSLQSFIDELIDRIEMEKDSHEKQKLSLQIARHIPIL